MSDEQKEERRSLVDPRYVLKEDFVTFAEMIAQNHENQKKILESQNSAIEKFDRALFGTEDEKGLMVIAGKIDNHIDVFCNVAKWSYRLVVGMVGVVAPLVVIGHNLNWW